VSDLHKSKQTEKEVDMKSAEEAYAIAKEFAECDSNTFTKRLDFTDGLMCGTNGRVAVMVKSPNAPKDVELSDGEYAKRVVKLANAFRKNCEPENYTIGGKVFNQVEAMYIIDIDRYNSSRQISWNTDYIRVECPHCGHSFTVDDDGDEVEKPVNVDGVEYKVILKYGEHMALVNWQYLRLILKHGRDALIRLAEYTDEVYKWHEIYAEDEDGEKSYMLMSLRYLISSEKENAEKYPIINLEKKETVND
jgi:hypothetical protein